jgi:hypothetical protein
MWILTVAKTLNLKLSCVTKYSDLAQAVSTPTSYSGGHGFKPQREHWLPWLKILMVLHPSK